MIIYRATNILNKKIYIGQTIQKLSRRIIGHKHTAKSNRVGRFNNAIRKYGIENFEWKVICDCFSFEDLQIAEIAFIAYYNSTNRKLGYNNSSGGKNGLHSEETKKLLSEQRRGRKLDEEWKNNVSLGVKKASQTKFPLDENLVVIMYKECLSTETVARELKTSRRRVRGILQKNNIDRIGVHKPRTQKQIETSSNNGKRKRSQKENEASRKRMLGNSYGKGYKPTKETILRISNSLKGRKISKETLEKIKIASIKEDGKHFNTKRINNINELIEDYKSGLTRKELEEKYNAEFDTLLVRIKELHPLLPEQYRKIRMSLCKKRINNNKNTIKTCSV